MNIGIGVMLSSQKNNAIITEQNGYSSNEQQQETHINNSKREMELKPMM